METEYRDFGYTTPGAANEEVGRNLAEIFVNLIRNLDGVKDICDLGCGNGYLASRLGESGFHVTGIDASESGLEIASRHYATDKVNFVRAELGADIKTLLPEGLVFDAVVSSDVIEHLYRPAELIETAAALLRPGGYLLVGTLYHGYLKNLAISVLNGWDSHHGVNWDGGHIKFFSVRTLRAVIARHGFQDLTFHCHGRLPLLWMHMICVARREA